MSIASLQRRLDSIAIDQLRAEVSRLAAENDQLRDRAERAEQSADWWAQDAKEMHLQLCEAVGGQPGITLAGELVVAPTETFSSSGHDA